MTGLQAGRAPRREGAAVGAFVAVVVGTVAAFLRAPGLLYADSGELLTAVALKGIAHPPGFPLYLMAGGWWLDLTKFLSLSSASRLNLLSSLFDGVAAGSLAAAALFLLRRVDPDLPRGVRLSLAALAGFLAGFGPTLFDFSLGIEVYAAHAVFLAAALLFAVLGGDADDPRHRALLTLFSGLAAGGGLAIHHATMVVILPGLALLLWGDEPARRRWKRVGLFALALVPGLSCYVLLPIRARTNPVLNWGNPSNTFRFWNHLSAHDYQVNIENSLSTIFDHAGRFLDAYRAEFSLAGFALAVAGAFFFFRKGRWAGAGLLLVILGDIAFAVRYDIAEDQAAYYIPTFFATALLVVLGIAALVSRIPPNRNALRHPALAIVLVGGAFLIARNVHGRNRSRDGRAIESVENFFASAPQGALVFTPEWNLYAPALAAREVDAKRPDLLVLDVLLLRRGWYLDTFARRNPERYREVKGAFDSYRAALADWEERRPYDGDRLTNLLDGFTASLTRAAWKRGAPVTWIGTVLLEHLPSGCALVPSGIGYRVLDGKAAAAESVEDAPLTFRMALDPSLPFEETFELKIRPLYVSMLAQRATLELSKGRTREAEARIAAARQLNSADPLATEVAGDILAAAMRPSEALDLYADALRNGGDGARLGQKSRRALAASTSPKKP